MMLIVSSWDLAFSVLFSASLFQGFRCRSFISDRFRLDPLYAKKVWAPPPSSSDPPPAISRSSVPEPLPEVEEVQDWCCIQYRST
jgi:hypothetical protein